MGSSGLRQELEIRYCAHCYNALSSKLGKLHRETLVDVLKVQA